MTEEGVWAFLQNEWAELIDADVETLSLDSRLEDLQIDSLAAVQTQIALKRRYGIDVPDSLFVPEAKSTIRDICQIVVNESSSGST